MDLKTWMVGFTYAPCSPMRSATSSRKLCEPSGSLNTQWMIMSTPASRELTVPCVEVQCAAVSLPNLCASSVMASSSSRLNGRQKRVRGPGTAACGGDLDVVGALLDELPHHRPGGLGASDLGAHVAHMAAYGGHGATAEHHAGAYLAPGVDGVAQPEHGDVLGAVLAYRRNPGEERDPGVAGGLEGEDLVGQEGQVVSEASVAEAVVVRMAVDHSGHDRCVGIVEDLDLGTLRRRLCGLGPHGDDLCALDQHCAAYRGPVGDTVNQPGCADELEGSLTAVQGRARLPRPSSSPPSSISSSSSRGSSSYSAASSISSLSRPATSM